jgi:hypothetical protein
VFPEECSGPGEDGLGRTCLEDIGFDLDSDGQFNAIDICVDIHGPVLTETTLGHDTQNNLVIAQMGTDCRANPDDFLRCPDFTTCFTDQNGLGLCLRGCNSSGGGPRGGCETDPSTQTSVCTDELLSSPPEGVCAEP